MFGGEVGGAVFNQIEVLGGAADPARRYFIFALTTEKAVKWTKIDTARYLPPVVGSNDAALLPVPGAVLAPPHPANTSRDQFGLRSATAEIAAFAGGGNIKVQLYGLARANEETASANLAAAIAATGEPASCVGNALVTAPAVSTATKSDDYMRWIQEAGRGSNPGGYV